MTPFCLQAMDDWHTAKWKSVTSLTMKSREHTLKKITNELQWLKQELDQHYNGEKRALIDPSITSSYHTAENYLLNILYDEHVDIIKIDSFISTYSKTEPNIIRIVKEIKQIVLQQSEQAMIDSFSSLNVATDPLDQLANALNSLAVQE